MPAGPQKLITWPSTCKTELAEMLPFWQPMTVQCLRLLYRPEQAISLRDISMQQMVASSITMQTAAVRQIGISLSQRLTALYCMHSGRPILTRWHLMLMAEAAPWKHRPWLMIPTRSLRRIHWPKRAICSPAGLTKPELTAQLTQMKQLWKTLQQTRERTWPCTLYGSLFHIV